MSERERWIIYPLLLLALGSSLRDKLFNRTVSQSIICESLRVVDDNRSDSGFHELIALGPNKVEGRTVSGVLRVGYIEADVVRVRQVVADNYVVRGVPVNPLGRMVVPISPADLYQFLNQARKPSAMPPTGDSAAPLDDSNTDANNAPGSGPKGGSAPENPSTDRSE
jgi:hypothetical protein